MNKIQLEQILQHCKAISELIEEDTEGAMELRYCNSSLFSEAQQRLKDIVWQEYLQQKEKQQ